MKYMIIREQYDICNNDGSGPFPKDVNGVLISYDSESGNPERAIMTLETPLEDIKEYGIRRIIEEEPSKLVKIVKYFHKK